MQGVSFLDIYMNRNITKPQTETVRVKDDVLC